MKDESKIDEILELIWTLRERGKNDLQQVLAVKIAEPVHSVSAKAKEEHVRDLLSDMKKRELITVEDGRVSLTAKGGEWAEKIIRRHRLAERLLAEAFDLGDEHVHKEACKFEHILSPEVTDSVCTFLGHPALCPHGNAIPRGECCTKFRRDIKPLVAPLRDFEPGEEGRIVFITPREHTRLDRLASLGVLPGSIIKLHQKHPSYVVKIGETELAIDEEIAGEIYVKKVKR